VVASNDGTARGAVQALEGQHLAGKVLVSGQDADLASLKLIAEGKQTMTVYKSIQPLAYGAVDAAVKLARGEKVATTETIDNTFKKVPAILLEPVAVDRNTLVGTVVKDGYHTLAEICAGLPPEKCPTE
jgi:D-xylose transport system substrate-binding protein